MKKIELLFALGAVLLAMGGAFASRNNGTTNTVAYEYISSSQQCKSHNVVCFDEGDVPCTVTGVAAQLRETSVIENSCGDVMWKED